MNRIFYILVICCQAFGVSAQSVADAGLFTYSAAGTVTASLGGNGVAWGPDAFAVFRNSAQGALADAKVIAGYAVSSWMPGWDLADRHWMAVYIRRKTGCTYRSALSESAYCRID